MFTFDSESEDWSFTFKTTQDIKYALEVGCEQDFDSVAEWTKGGAGKEFDVVKALSPFQNTRWFTQPPPGVNVSSLDPFEEDDDDPLYVFLDQDLVYEVCVHDFEKSRTEKRSIFFEKRFPKFWPVRSGHAGEILDRETLPFLRKQSAEGVSNFYSVWYTLKNHISVEKEKFPIPGPESKNDDGKPRIVQEQRSDGTWVCVLKLRGKAGEYAPFAGAVYDAATRSWKATCPEQGASAQPSVASSDLAQPSAPAMETHEVTMVSMPLGSAFEPIMAYRFTRASKMVEYQLVQVPSRRFTKIV